MKKKRIASVALWVSLAVIVSAVALCYSVDSARERARRVSCCSNLKFACFALHMYAADHGEIYPERLAEIGKYLAFQPALFRCFGSGNEPGTFETVDEWTDYVYVPGLPESVLPDTVIMYCPAKNHKGEGGNVLFGDGHVEWFNTQNHCGEDETSFEDVIGTIGKRDQ
jgi:prepilin-type processing-associated H-X9-DG protein